MPASCRFPEHHHAGGGFPWGLAVIVAGAVIVGTSAAFASAMHDVMVMVLAVCGVVAILGPVALWRLTGYVARTDYMPAPGRVLQPSAAARSVTASQSPAAPAPAVTAAVEAAPVVHQHLHLHGAEAIALLGRRQP